MSLMRAPKVERKHLLALKTLLRLDFARAIRNRVETLKATGEHPAESTARILAITDALSEADQPLSVTMALMEMHGAPAAWMPLADARFEFYSRLLAIDVTDEDFRGVSADSLEEVLAPLRAIQVELRQIFADSGHVDAGELLRKPQTGLSGSLTINKPSGDLPN